MDEKEWKLLREKVKPIIFWHGFPVCGLLLKGVAAEFGKDVIICGTRNAVPFENLEETLGHEIIWFEDSNDIWKQREKFLDRNLIIHSGWSFDGWKQYDQLMKKLTGAKVVVMADNRFRGSIKQYLGTIWFRLFLKKYFDAALVPGKSGQKLMRFLGMEKLRIFTGLYGAYEGIYHETLPISQRPNEFLFVGQLIKRKSVDVLIEAFNNYRSKGGKWDLRIIGSGPLQEIVKGDGIFYENSAQPQVVAQKMNNSRVLILISRDDNWGTVVCEAAACGMNLITSRGVGASDDLVRSGENGVILDKITPSEMEKALFYCENMSKENLEKGSEISKRLASEYNSVSFLDVFKKIAKVIFG